MKNLNFFLLSIFLLIGVSESSQAMIQYLASHRRNDKRMPSTLTNKENEEKEAYLNRFIKLEQDAKDQAKNELEKQKTEVTEKNIENYINSNYSGFNNPITMRKHIEDVLTNK